MPEHLPLEKQLEEIVHSINTLYKKFLAQEERLRELEKRVNFSGALRPSLPVPPPPTAPKPATPVAARPRESFEEKVGGRWLAKIGVVALVLGVSFFLKYAFDNNWIGPTGRVILGIIGGIALLVLGEFFRKKYLAYSQIVSGGGIAILYLSIYAAYGWYSLVDQTLAYLFMTFVTVAAGFFSIRAGQPPLLIMGMLGGFLTPALIGSEERGLYELFTYILILNLGVLGVSFFKKWRALNLIALIFTLLYQISWQSQTLKSEEIWPTALYASIFFLIFTAATVSHNIWRKERSDFFDTSILLINSFSYFLFLWDLFEGNKNGMSFYALLLAILYFGLAQLIFERNREDRILALFLPGLSVTYLTIAMGIMFRQHWITIAWAVEAGLLAWISFQLKERNFRIFSLVLFALVLIRLLGYHTDFYPGADYVVLFNARVLAYAAGIASYSFAVWLFASHKELLSRDEKSIISVLIVAANFLALLVLSQEVFAYYGKIINGVSAGAAGAPQNSFLETFSEGTSWKKIGSIRNQLDITLSILWALYSAGLVAAGFLRKSRLLRIAGILLFGITLFKLFLVDLWSLGQLYRIISSIALGIILLVTAFLYQRYKERIKEII